MPPPPAAPPEGPPVGAAAGHAPPSVSSSTTSTSLGAASSTSSSASLGAAAYTSSSASLGAAASTSASASLGAAASTSASASQGAAGPSPPVTGAVCSQKRNPDPLEHEHSQKRRLDVEGPGVVRSIPFEALLDFIDHTPLVAKLEYSLLDFDLETLMSWKEEEGKKPEESGKEEQEEGQKPEESGKEEEPNIENTEAGYWLGEGFFQEIVTVHSQGLSWGGQFDLSHMYASKIGKYVTIDKEPKLEASILNTLLDFRQVAECLFTRYKLENGTKRPPFLEGLMTRINTMIANEQNRHRNMEVLMDQVYKKIQEQKQEDQSLPWEWDEERIQLWHDYHTILSWWMLQNDPFYVDPGNIKDLFGSFYSFYKAIPKKTLDATVQQRNRNLCENWHIAKVRKNAFLYYIYWSKIDPKTKQQYPVPPDYFIRPPEFLEGDNDYEVFPYTPQDDYLSLFIRTCIIHGPDIMCRMLDFHVFEKQILAIVSHYFEDFIPKFVEDIWRTSVDSKILKEGLDRYAKREIRSWRMLVKWETMQRQMQEENDLSSGA